MKKTKKADRWPSRYPWETLGDEVRVGGSAYDTLNDLARDGERLSEPEERIRCYLRRLTATEQETLSAQNITEDRHAAIALWTEDEEHPRGFEDRMQLLEEYDVARIERNSFTTAMQRAAKAYKSAEDAGLDPESPAGHLIDLIVGAPR